MFGVGQGELLLILLAVLILFGAKRIPEVARSLGKGLGDFREAMSGFEREVKGEPPIRKAPPKELTAGPDAGGPSDRGEAAPAPEPAEGTVPAEGPSGPVTDREPLPEDDRGIDREAEGGDRPSRSHEDGWPEDPYRHLRDKPGPGRDLQG